MGTQIGLLHVRRSILIQATPARVWGEFSSFERVVEWLGLGHQLHVFEPRLGGTVDMSVDIEGQRRHYGGPVLIWESEREVTFASNWHDPPSGAKTRPSEIVGKPDFRRRRRRLLSWGTLRPV